MQPGPPTGLAPDAAFSLLPPPAPAAPVGPKQASRLDLHSPILKPGELESIKAMSYRGWETKVRGAAPRRLHCLPCPTAAALLLAAAAAAWQRRARPPTTPPMLP